MRRRPFDGNVVLLWFVLLVVLLAMDSLTVPVIFR